VTSLEAFDLYYAAERKLGAAIGRAQIAQGKAQIEAARRAVTLAEQAAKRTHEAALAIERSESNPRRTNASFVDEHRQRTGRDISAAAKQHESELAREIKRRPRIDRQTIRAIFSGKALTEEEAAILIRDFPGVHWRGRIRGEDGEILKSFTSRQALDTLAHPMTIDRQGGVLEIIGTRQDAKGNNFNEAWILVNDDAAATDPQ